MDQGLLVPDELTVRILLDRVAQDDCKNGYVLDGFPRTIPQAEVLDSELTKLGDHIDYAINVDVPDENIVKRMSGRRACLTCGATYHIEHVPPKKEGICDVCGSELVLRDDDKPETVKNRLNVYHEQTQPLIDFYTEKRCIKDCGRYRSDGRGICCNHRDSGLMRADVSILEGNYGRFN